jgi:hypothetical protein
MSTVTDNAGSRLWLAARANLFMMVLIVITVTTLAVVATPGLVNDEDVLYEASAVVVAKELTIRPEGLPRFATAVFEGGSVAEAAVAADPTLPYAADKLIPDHVQAKPFENTVVIEIIAEDRNAELAARLANTVSRAYVRVLNERAGPTVGVFEILDTARTPTTPSAAGGKASALVVGVLTGLLVACAGLVVLLSVRRPILSAADASRIAGVPVLANLKLGHGRRRRDVSLPPGSAALARQLFPGLSGMCALLDTERSAQARRKVAMLLCRVLEPGGEVYLVSAAGPAGWPELRDGSVTISTSIPTGRVWARSPILIDDPNEADLPLLQPPNARLALVVVNGGTEAALEVALSRFIPGDLAGLVFVTLQRRFIPRRWPRGGAATGPVANPPTSGTGQDTTEQAGAPELTSLPHGFGAQPDPSPASRP